MLGTLLSGAERDGEREVVVLYRLRGRRSSVLVSKSEAVDLP